MIILFSALTVETRNRNGKRVYVSVLHYMSIDDLLGRRRTIPALSSVQSHEAGGACQGFRMLRTRNRRSATEKCATFLECHLS